MPYRAKKYAGKRMYRRKGTKLNKRQKKEVKRLITGIEEHKFSDTALLGSIITSNSPTIVSAPAQGSGSNQRVGDDINIKRMKLRCSISGGGAVLGVADQFNVVRCVIFRWSQNNNVTAPVLADVFQYPAASFTSPLNWDSIDQGKIKVCMDRTFTYTQSGTQVRSIIADIYGKRLHGSKVKYNAGATTGVNQFYIHFVSDSTVAPSPAVIGYLRYEYTDS